MDNTEYKPEEDIPVSLLRPLLLLIGAGNDGINGNKREAHAEYPVSYRDGIPETQLFRLLHLRRCPYNGE